MSLTDYRIALVLIANECVQPTDKYTIARIQSIAHDALSAGVHLTGDERLRELLALAEVIPLSHDLEQAVGQAEVVIAALRAALTETEG